MRISRRILVGVSAAALIAGVGGGIAAAANASTTPLINVTVGSSAGGVAGYYGADDGHSHWRFVQTTVVASPTLNNLNGTTELGAVGAELCNENTGDAAQIGLYDNNGVYGVAYDQGSLSTSFDDPCIDAGLINSNILAAPQLLNHTTIHTGDRILLSIYYNPASHFKHELQFSATDLSQVNEHRSATDWVWPMSFTEWGTGVVSNASSVTAALNNNLETFNGSVVNFYSSTKPAEAISKDIGYYNYGGLSQVQYVNTSTQPEISPNSSLSGENFTVFEGSTTP